MGQRGERLELPAASPAQAQSHGLPSSPKSPVGGNVAQKARTPDSRRAGPGHVKFGGTIEDDLGERPHDERWHADGQERHGEVRLHFRVYQRLGRDWATQPVFEQQVEASPSAFATRLPRQGMAFDAFVPAGSWPPGARIVEEATREYLRLRDRKPVVAVPRQVTPVLPRKLQYGPERDFWQACLHRGGTLFSDECVEVSCEITASSACQGSVHLSVTPKGRALRHGRFTCTNKARAGLVVRPMPITQQHAGAGIGHAIHFELLELCGGPHEAPEVKCMLQLAHPGEQQPEFACRFRLPIVLCGFLEPYPMSESEFARVWLSLEAREVVPGSPSGLAQTVGSPSSRPARDPIGREYHALASRDAFRPFAGHHARVPIADERHGPDQAVESLRWILSLGGRLEIVDLKVGDALRNPARLEIEEEEDYRPSVAIHAAAKLPRHGCRDDEPLVLVELRAQRLPSTEAFVEVRSPDAKLASTVLESYRWFFSPEPFQYERDD